MQVRPQFSGVLEKGTINHRQVSQATYAAAQTRVENELDPSTKITVHDEDQLTGLNSKSWVSLAADIFTSGSNDFARVAQQYTKTRFVPAKLAARLDQGTVDAKFTKLIDDAIIKAKRLETDYADRQKIEAAGGKFPWQ